MPPAVQLGGQKVVFFTELRLIPTSIPSGETGTFLDREGGQHVAAQLEGKTALLM